MEWEKAVRAGVRGVIFGLGARGAWAACCGGGVGYGVILGKDLSLHFPEGRCFFPGDAGCSG